MSAILLLYLSPAAALVAPATAGTTAAGSFEAWARSADIVAPRLRIDDEDLLRGVTVLADVSAGEILCEVPRRRCLDLSAISVDPAKAGRSPCEGIAPTPLWSRLLWFERLAIWMLAEARRGSESEICGYIDYLPAPDTFADSLLEWSDAELAEFRYPPLASAVREQKESLADLLAAIRAAGGSDAAGVTMAELSWAEQIVLSRAFTSDIAKGQDGVRASRMGSDKPPPPPPKNGVLEAWERSELRGKLSLPALPNFGSLLGGGSPASSDAPLAMALMPMLDSFNHRSGAKNGCSFDPERNAFVLTAGEPLRAGEQAFISYGDKGNDELLQLFGFVEEANPHDTILAVGLAEHASGVARALCGGRDAEVARRLGLVEEQGVLPSLEAAELSARGAPVGTWHALRILLGSADEVSGAGASILARPASLETEARCWAAMRTYCKAARSAMGGPRKADLTELRAKGCAPRRRLALQFRSEKKRLLSELEAALGAVEARSRKAGKPMASAVTL